MAKLDIINEKINLFKKELAIELGVLIENIELDVTCTKVPQQQIDSLENQGLEIKVSDTGIGVMRSTNIEEWNSTIHVYGQIKSNLMDTIYEICKPDPSYDKDEAKFEAKRDDEDRPYYTNPGSI